MSGQWKLVPVEPTETMVINGFESEPDECFTDEEVWEQYKEMSGCQQAAFRSKLCWAAMLGSAPSAPTDGQIEVVAVVNEQGEYFKETFVEHRPGIDRLLVGTELVDRAHVIRLQAERDALQLSLNAADQRIDELISAVRSINRSKHHEVFVPGDDQPQYRQRKEWVDWVLSLCDEAASTAPSNKINNLTDVSLTDEGDMPAARRRDEAQIKGMIETIGGEFAIMIDEANAHYGWTFQRHPDGMWVSGRKATDAEMDAARAHARITNQQ